MTKNDTTTVKTTVLYVTDVRGITVAVTPWQAWEVDRRSYAYYELRNVKGAPVTLTMRKGIVIGVEFGRRSYEGVVEWARESNGHWEVCIGGEKYLTSQYTNDHGWADKIGQTVEIKYEQRALPTVVLVEDVFED